jgi:hypothetical protein
MQEDKVPGEDNEENKDKEDQVHNQEEAALTGNIVGHCSGNYYARGASGKKYEAQIVIFRILVPVNRFSWISLKVRKPLKKVRKSLKKVESR